MPADTLRFDVLEYPDGLDYIVDRGGKLFQPENGTFQFDDAIKLTVFTKLDWNDLDLPVRRSIAATAASRYAQVANGDAGVMRRLSSEEMDFRGIAKSADVRSSQRNIFDGDAQAFNARNRRLSTGGASARRYPGV